MKKRPTSLHGVVLLEPRSYADERGWFMELYKESTYLDVGLSVRFVQDNVSMSHRGVIRGLHLQIPPFGQGKLITCLRGAIFDVVVDLRPESPTFGKWVAQELTERNRSAWYVPPGLAHGFQALEDTSLVLYKCTAAYSKEHEDGILFNDTELGIAWPLAPPVLSPKDLDLPVFADWKTKNGIR